MQQFQYIENKYTPSVNLEVYSKTLDTLQQGHENAVKAKTALELELAKLPLNEKDEWYRRQYADKIQAVIDSKTRYGNSYAALSDLTEMVGSLGLDEGMRGRIESNKNYEEFRTLVRNSQDLPENYKQYYLESNPYNYEDKYDENGKIIQGDLWQPNSHPTKHIELSTVIPAAIQMAAEESGKKNVTRWLDSNGNITTDPMKAYDGEIFDSTTSEWHRLGRDKILKAINAVIDSSPAVKASVSQDYNVAKWEHDKAAKEWEKTHPNEVFVDDMTTPDGNLLTENQFLQKQLNPFADIASYNRATSQTTYGEGLATYKAGLRAIEQAKAEQNSGGLGNAGGNTDVSNALDETGYGHTMTVDYDAASKWQENLQNAIGQANDIFERNLGRKLNVDMSMGSDVAWNNVINNAIKEGRKKGLNETQLSKLMVDLRGVARTAAENRDNLNRVRNQLNDDEKQRFDFITRQKNGASYDNKNKYDRQYQYKVKQIYGNAAYIGFDFDNEAEASIMLDKLGGGTPNGWKKLGYELKQIGGKYVVLLDTAHQRQLKQAVEAYDSADQRILGYFRERLMTRYDKNFNSLNNVINRGISPTMGLSLGDKDVTRSAINSQSTSLVSFVDDLNKENERSLKSIIPTKINYDSTLFPAITANQYEYNKKRDNKQLDINEYNSLTKTEQEAFKTLAMQNPYTNNQMFYIDNTVGTLTQIKGSDERAKIGLQIRNAVAKDKFSASFVNDPIYGVGSYITFDAQDANGNFLDNYKQTVFVPGLIHGGFATKLENHPYTKASNAIRVGNAIGSTFTLTSINEYPRVKTQTLSCGNNSNTVIYSGFDKNITLDLSSAAHVKTIYEEINTLKDAIQSGLTPLNNAVSQQRYKELLSNYCNQLSNYLGISADQLYILLDNDIKEKQ